MYISILKYGPETRVRWVYDVLYETVGSYAYDSPEETAKAEADEIAKIQSGEVVPMGAILETRCSACGQWEEQDAIWGVVISTDLQSLQEWAEHTFGIDPATRGE